MNTDLYVKQKRTASQVIDEMYKEAGFMDSAKNLGHNIVDRTRGIGHNALNKTRGIGHNIVDKTRGIGYNISDKIFRKSRAARAAEQKVDAISNLKEKLRQQNSDLEKAMRQRKINLRNSALASIPVTAGSAGIGAGIARLGSSRRVNPDETPEERKQRINKATKRGALIGGGLGIGASTVGTVLDDKKDRSAVMRQKDVVERLRRRIEEYNS